LDDIESAHRALRGPGAGVRTATQQVNQAYAVLLASQYQAFCRELHTECADYLVSRLTDPGLRVVLRLNLLLNRKLDRGNPNPGNIGSDFNRLNVPFWSLVDAPRAQNPQRRRLLEELNEWRNAIAHHDFSPAMLRGGRPALSLAQVQGWRRACEVLARSFDEMMRTQIQALTGTAPWERAVP
jgi:hypothetical protein